MIFHWKRKQRCERNFSLEGTKQGRKTICRLSSCPEARGKKKCKISSVKKINLKLRRWGKKREKKIKFIDGIDAVETPKLFIILYFLSLSILNGVIQ